MKPNGSLYTLAPMGVCGRITQWRVCAVICLSLAGLSSCVTTGKPAPPKAVSGGVQFIISLPEARSVVVAGSFNGWSPEEHRMARVGTDGVWSVVIPLPEGEHMFMYLVDDKTWMAPPVAEDFVTDGFGNTNGIVVVR